LKGKVTAQQLLPKVSAICEREISDCPVVDGLIFTSSATNDLLDPMTAGRCAARHAVVYKLSGDERFRSYTRDLLAYAGRSLVTSKGVSFFPQGMPNWSDDGRTLRRAFCASRWIRDDTAMEWISQMIRNWPYKEQEHKYVERFAPGPNAESSRKSFAYSLNMLLEGGLDAYLVGRHIGDEQMKARGRAVIEQIILPNQREDGLWNYAAKREGCDPWRLGTEEYNYSQYVAEMLAYLLEYPEWRERLLDPVRRSLDELCRRFELGDGAFYARVHWGWDHVFESTLNNASLAWKLYHHAGQTQYGELIARRLSWLEKVDVGPGYQGSLRYMYNEHNLWEMMAEGLAVEGDLPALGDTLAVLERMERELSIIPADNAHCEGYFTRKYNFSHLVLQRKIHAIRTELAGGEPAELLAGAGRDGAELELPWRFDSAQMSCRIRARWTQEAFSMRAAVTNAEHHQPYYGAQMDRGDSMSFIIELPDGKEVRLTAALTRNGPEVFRYADDISFSSQRDWAKDIHEGELLPGAALEVYVHSGLVEYELSLPWSVLGIEPKKGLQIPLTIMINKLMGAGFQFMIWGKDVRDNWTDGHKLLHLA